MDIPLLIALNLFAVPFLQEAELLGQGTQRLPTLAAVFRLKRVAASSWFKPFCAGAAIFVFAVFILAATAGRSIDVATLLFNLVVMQILLWGWVVFNIFKRVGGVTVNHKMSPMPSTRPPQCVTPAVRADVR